MINWLDTIIGLIIGYIAGVYLPNKFRKEDKMPNISISEFQEDYNGFEITNHGGDILNLKISIKWFDEGREGYRELKDFLNENENPTFVIPHKINCIKKSETKKVKNCPLYSNKGIDIIITGTDVDGREYIKNDKLYNFKR